MVPEGWREIPLGEFMEFKNGLNADSQSYGKGRKFINVMDVFSGSSLRADQVRGSVEVSEGRQAESAVRYGDVVFNRTSEVREEIAFASTYLDKEEDVLFGGFVIRGRQTNDTLLPEYCVHCFSDANVRRQMIRRAQGAVRANIGQRDLATVTVLVPPESEQHKIAEILSTWDKAIATTEKLLKNSQKMQRGLLRTLFRSYETETPNGWRECTLGDIAEINPSTAQPKGQTVHFIDMNSVSSDGTIERVKVMDRSSLPTGCTSFADEDVLVAKITPCFENGKGAYVKDLMEGAGFGSTEFHVLRAKPEFNSRLLYFVTRTSEFRARGTANMQGSSGHRRVPKDFLHTYKLSIPTEPDEQNYIADVLTLYEEQTTVLHELIESTREAKRGLMQQLLTGKRRVDCSQKDAMHES